jgi:hypothetical protein
VQVAHGSDGMAEVFVAIYREEKRLRFLLTSAIRFAFLRAACEAVFKGRERGAGYLDGGSQWPCIRSKVPIRNDSVCQKDVTAQTLSFDLGGGGVPIGDGGLGQRPPRARFVAASGRILPGRASEPPPPPHGGNSANLAREKTSEGMEGRGGVGGVGWWG